MANEKRIRVSVPAGTLANTLSSGATSITETWLTGLGAVDSTNHIPLILERGTANEEIAYITLHTSGAGSATIGKGKENTSDITHSAGATIETGPTLRDYPKAPVFARRTSGGIAVSSTSWVNLDTGLDLSLTAQAGDVVEVGLSAAHANQAVTLYMDVGSLVSGSIVNTWGQDGPETATSQGVLAWFSTGNDFRHVGGSVVRRIVSGDVSGGTLTLRFRVRVFSATSRTISADADTPLVVWARNCGVQVA